MVRPIIVKMTRIGTQILAVFLKNKFFLLPFEFVDRSIIEVNGSVENHPFYGYSAEPFFLTVHVVSADWGFQRWNLKLATTCVPQQS
jgi:hypothetical protein